MRTTTYGTPIDHMPAKADRLLAAMARVKSVWRALRNRFASNRLYDLDDSLLDDIGLTRNDVAKALHHSSALDDPSLLLTNAARQRARTRFSRVARR
jgi:uncharacterized protein YjiS (DUF1127 family)